MKSTAIGLGIDNNGQRSDENMPTKYSNPTAGPNVMIKVGSTNAQLQAPRQFRSTEIYINHKVLANYSHMTNISISCPNCKI